MRKYTKAILLMLVALFYAGTAGAVAINVIETSVPPMGPGEYDPSDVLTVDIVIDTEGAPIYGFTMILDFDVPGLSPVGATLNPIAGIDPGYYSPYMFPSYFYIGGVSWAGSTGLLNVATLVFHVMDVPASTLLSVTPNLDDPGSTPGLFILAAGGVQLENADVTRNALTIHVPEPTTTMLIGLGLFGILYAGRRR